MDTALIRNLNRLDVPQIEAKYCESFGCQLRGLSFRKQIAGTEGLLLVQRHDSIINASIHMLGMWFDICVIWINAQGVIVDNRIARRWRLAYFPASPAKYVLETHPGRLQDYRIGDHVEISVSDTG
jgi:uncharacterized protein